MQPHPTNPGKNEQHKWRATLSRVWVVLSMHRASLIILGVLVVWMCGCTAQNPTGAPAGQTAQTASAPTPGLVNPAIVTATRLPATRTPTRPASTPTQTVSPTQTPIVQTTNTPEVSAHCQVVSIVSFNEFQLEGSLIFIPLPLSEPKEVALLDLETSEERTFYRNGDAQVSGFKVSPNRQFVVYSTFDIEGYHTGDSPPVEKELYDYRLVVANSRGEPLVEWPYFGGTVFDQNPGSWVNWDWLNNETLLIDTFSRDATDQRIVFKPFTGEMQAISIIDNNEWLLDGWQSKIFDRWLTRAVYPGLSDAGERSLVMWDYVRGEAVVIIPTNKFINFHEPAWSPDQSQIAVSLSLVYHLDSPYRQELYTISRDGDLMRWTYLTDIYPDVTVDGFAWSPDGDQLVFWWDDRSKKSEDGIAILDLETGEYTQYCLPFSRGNSLLWSPDGTTILANISDDEKNSLELIVLDPSRNILAQFPKGMLPLGWMR